MKRLTPTINIIVSVIIFLMIASQVMKETHGQVDLPYLVLFLIFAIVIISHIFRSVKQLLSKK